MSVPLLIFFVVLGSMKQARWKRVYITLKNKLFRFLWLILWPMGFIFLALIELGVPGFKAAYRDYCSCFCHRGHDAWSIAFYPDS